MTEPAELTALRVNRMMREQSADDLPRLIDAARRAGITWPAIADAAGMTRVGAIRAQKRSLEGLT